jgi:hypothetical protein
LQWRGALALKHDWNITKEKLVWMTGKRTLRATFKELAAARKAQLHQD